MEIARSIFKGLLKMLSAQLGLEVLCQSRKDRVGGCQCEGSSELPPELVSLYVHSSWVGSAVAKQNMQTLICCSTFSNSSNVL